MPLMVMFVWLDYLLRLGSRKALFFPELVLATIIFTCIVNLFASISIQFG